MACLDARDTRRRRRRTVRIAVALPLALVLLIAGALLVFRPGSAPPEVASSVARAEEIRGQYRALQQELERLQQASAQRQRVLYLGANDDYDLVVDLNPLLDRHVGTPAVPALQALDAGPARTDLTHGRRP